MTEKLNLDNDISSRKTETSRVEGKIIFEYSCVPPGTVVKKGEIKKNRFYLDVGNNYKTGVFDHHQMGNDGGSEHTCAAKMVYEAPNFITSNLTGNLKTVEIIVHEEPDLDCIAAAYLLQKYIENNDFPQYTKKLTDYVSIVDSGNDKIIGNDIRVPFAVVPAIKIALEREQGKRLKSSDPDILRRIMERGFKLIELMIEALKNKKDLEKCPDLFENTDFNDKEIRILQEDWQKFQQDLKECKVVDVKLPHKDSSRGKLVQVKGLIWHKEPRCLLHKNWARASGYCLTVIPYNPYSDDHRVFNTSRIIISVPPDSEVNLKGLAEILEGLEWERETTAYLCGIIHSIRDRSTRRFPDTSWVQNRDPWFDGRTYNYTIVDAPSRGTLLDLETVIWHTLNFTKPQVYKQLSRFVYPFNFDSKNMNELYNLLQKKGFKEIEKGKLLDEFDRSDFLLPYMQDYLLPEDNEKIEKRNCIFFNWDKFSNHNQDLTLHLPHQHSTDKTENLQDENDDREETAWQEVAAAREKTKKQNEKRSIEFREENLRVILFKYGVGFLLLDTRVSLRVGTLLDDILDFNNLMAKQRGMEYFSQIFGEIVNMDWFNTRMFKNRGLVYTCVSLDRRTFYMSEKKKILYQIANLMSSRERVYEKTPFGTGADRLFLECSESSMISFSKNGGCFVDIGTPFQPENCINPVALGKVHAKSDLEESQKLFLYQDFYLFILALHQRLVLLNFSYLLARGDRKKKIKEIKELHSKIMEFTTQSWFSQVAYKEFSMEIFRRWCDIFETKKLYDEIFYELTAVENYYRASRTQMIETITFIAFPLIILITFFPMNFEKIPSLGVSSVLLGQFTFFFGLYFVLLCVLYLFIKKK